MPTDCNCERKFGIEVSLVSFTKKDFHLIMHLISVRNELDIVSQCRVPGDSPFALSRSSFVARVVFLFEYLRKKRMKCDILEWHSLKTSSDKTFAENEKATLTIVSASWMKEKGELVNGQKKQKSVHCSFS
jgi:hypothetical protein